MRTKRFPLAAIAAAGIAAGCASPILQIDGPGYSLAASPAVKSEPQSMSQSIQKLNYFHAKYYEAIRNQQDTVQNTSAGLVWLGAGIAGLAAGHAHRDAIVGASLIGGTTYAVTRTQLDERRIKVWQEGLEALDCAKEATIPLDIGDAKARELQEARNALTTAGAAVVRAQADVKAQLGAANRTPKSAHAEELVRKAASSLRDADKTVTAADRLLQAAKGLELSSAVDRIHTKVTAAMNSFQAGLSSVKAEIESIGSFASIFAPGVDTTFTNAFNRYVESQPKAAPVPGQPAPQGLKLADPLDAAVESLDRAMESLVDAQLHTKRLLGSVDVASVSKALKRCNVEMPSLAIALTPASLTLPAAGGTKGFAISGGTWPYTVDTLDDPANQSVTFRLDPKTLRAGYVTSTSVAPAGEYTFLVSDSSPAHATQVLVVTVDAASRGASAAPAPAAKASAAKKPVKKASDVQATDAKDTQAATDAWQALLAALKKPDFKRKVQDVTLTVDSAAMKDNHLRVVFKCDKAPSQTLPPATLKDFALSADSAAADQLRKENALGTNLSRLDVSGTPSCAKS